MQGKVNKKGARGALSVYRYFIIYSYVAKASLLTEYPCLELDLAYLQYLLDLLADQYYLLIFAMADQFLRGY